ncbi:MAG: anaerobic ribonucleoside-triphosphate reductase activating protein [Desulfurococcaceae archaeon]
MDITLYGPGWKSISLVDVYGAPSFTLWLCGCNLRCPFCHNWRLATWRAETCSRMDLDRMLESLEASRALVEYFHVTGGEPLVQHAELAKLLALIRRRMPELKISLNTNMTLYGPLVKFLEQGLLDHVATDLKVPPRVMYGHDPKATTILWELFKRSLDVVSKNGVALELRVPVAKGVSLETYREAAEEVAELLPIERTVVIVQPLLSKPFTEPRDLEWCEQYCNPTNDRLFEVAKVLEDVLGLKVHVRKAPE